MDYSESKTKCIYIKDMHKKVKKKPNQNNNNNKKPEKNKPWLPPESLSRIINTINVTYTPHVMHAKVNIRLGSVLYDGMNN